MTHESHERVISGDLGGFVATRSQMAGAALIIGSYGEDLQHNEALIDRALANELTEPEIDHLESLRGTAEAAKRVRQTAADRADGLRG